MASGSALSRISPPPPRPIAHRVGVALGGIAVGVAVERVRVAVEVGGAAVAVSVAVAVAVSEGVAAGRRGRRVGESAGVGIIDSSVSAVVGRAA
jgi:hypothetical protein